MKPNLIDDRDKRTVHRRLAKKDYDNIITLSADRAHTVRLLDEGAVVMSNGVIDFYIQKGTLQRYMDSLPEDYVGSINLGHERFATFPILLGSWTKADLHLVDIGDGRMGLDVDLHLDYENPLMRAITQSADKYNYDLGVSAEFTYGVNEPASMELGVMIINELFISDFAIVGEAGNVNSSGIKLKGEPMAITMKELSAKLNIEGTDMKSMNEAIDQLLETQNESVEEPETEEVAEEAVEEAVEEAEEIELEVTEEETEEVIEESVEEDSEEVTLATVLDAINEIKAQLETAKAENETLKSQLAAKEEAEKDFTKKFKSLVVSLSDTPKKPEVKNEVNYTDGIGE